jgi:hypothetical protein
MSKNEEGLSLVEGGALIVERVERAAPKRGTFTLIVSDTMCFEVTESGRTLRLDFRPKTLRERAQMWRRRYGL